MKKLINRITEAFKIRFLPQEMFVKQKYKEKTGKNLDLKSPKTFNEKIQWLKLNYKNPILTKMADKVESKTIVEERVGSEYVIPAYRVYNRADEIKHSELPDKFALKATHGSGWNIIKTNKNDITEREIQNYFRYWLKKSYYLGSKEWAYKHIQPRVVCEELIMEEGNVLPKDYKFFCFHGEPTFVQINYDKFQNPKIAFYDTKWNKLPFSVVYPMENKIEKKPKNFEKMLEIAAILSKALPFLRVDFYNVNGRIYVGELTSYPSNGMGKFSDEKWNLIFGEKINLSNLSVN